MEKNVSSFEHGFFHKGKRERKSTGVVSGCREAMKYHRYTLANNRGDRNDLWPLRR